MRPDAPPRGVLRTATFRLAAALSLAFTGFALLLFGFIYWQTAASQTRQVDRFLRRETARLAALPPAILSQAVSAERADLHRLTFGAVFDGEGRPLSGGFAAHPPFSADGVPREFPAGGHPVRAVSVRLPDGRVLMVGRDVTALAALRQVVGRALLLGLAPALLLSLGVGVALSLRTLARLRGLHVAIARIMRGDLHERLPLRGSGDDLDRLTAGVNAMLDELEILVGQVRSAGDAIAHDLRTPLARLRARLERARASGGGEAIIAAADAGIGDLDQALALITALLRLGEIEAGHRRAGFAPLDAAALVAEAAEIYQPLAEEKGLALVVEAGEPVPMIGDRDLLMEAVANLLDNAVKFTPPGGMIAVVAQSESAGAALTVRDTGPGIDEALLGRIFDRFVRADGSRGAPGAGLGLSIVAAISRLHGMRVEARNLDRGCEFTLRPQAAA